MDYEPFSRVVIDSKLRETGWDINDLSKVVIEDYGIFGRAECILKDYHRRPLALIQLRRAKLEAQNSHNNQKQG
jgi:hypothetical protein